MSQQIKSVYFSCGQNIPELIYNLCIELLKRYIGIGKVRFWPKNSMLYDNIFYKELIESLDAFVFILPNNGWNMPIYQLSSGVRKELQIAQNAGKPVFLIYRSSEGWNIYATKMNPSGVTISGIAGTSHTFAEMCKNGDKALAIQAIGKVSREYPLTMDDSMNIIDNKDKRILLFNR